jgi:MFS family permease
MSDVVPNSPHLSRSELRKVIVASSFGSVFEFYDFYLYASLAPVIAAQFFSGVNPTAGFIFALLAFSAGFLCGPLEGWCLAVLATCWDGKRRSWPPSS